MEKNAENAEFLYCYDCDFKCCKKSNYDKHLLTQKHKNRTNLSNLEQKNAEKTQLFVCKVCKKKYNARNSLWYHEKKCETSIFTENKIIDHNTNDKDKLIMMIIKQNSELIKETSEFKNIMLKVLENGTTNNSNNTTTNSHNKSFNLQFFLNETCKDAMNIMDFVDSIKLQLSDLEKVGEIGYVDGISNIIVKNLKELDITKRPIHCADKKREILYVKDEDKWEKDDDKKKLRKVIKRVASKNQRLLLKFKEEHPDCGNSSSKYSDQHNKIIVESMGGSGDNDLEKEEKIIRKITKEVVIDKEIK